ncbi:MAG TPA: NINE protein [Candidatus Angelobacter sp.]|jgi:TM2 domain-containing membrane protein YozV
MTDPVCPYCRMPFDESSPPRVFCTACGTPHHEDCYQENGGCTVFGCARAPADDPKLQVSQSDLSAVNLPGQPYTPQQTRPYVSAQPAGAPQSSLQYGGPLGLSQAAAATAPANAPVAPAYGYPQQSPALAPDVTYGPQKNRSTFIVLGIFLGWLGIHNFYAGYTGRAVGQLCLTVLTLGYLGLASWVWAIVEICLVTKDSKGFDLN